MDRIAIELPARYKDLATALRELIGMTERPRIVAPGGRAIDYAAVERDVVPTTSVDTQDRPVIDT